MHFQITIPLPKIGTSFPLSLITKGATIKVLTLNAKQDTGNPIATQYCFTIKDKNKVVLQEVILELLATEEGGFYDIPVNLIYDGLDSVLYVTPMPTDSLVNGTLVAALELDALEIKQDDDGGWIHDTVRPTSPEPVYGCG
jgi:hypothetical protein